MSAAATAPTAAATATAAAAPTQLHRTSLRLLQAAMRAQLPGNLKLLLHTLCMHHNDQAGCAWPSIERLASLCSTSTRTVQRNLGELVQRGMVVVGRAPGIRSNAYAVQEARLHDIALPVPQRAAPAQPLWLRPTTTFAAPEVTPSAPTPDTHVTQTEVNETELKKTGEAPAPQQALEPAPEQMPEPAPTKALEQTLEKVLAKVLEQAPEQAEQNTAEKAALVQVNAQRQRNGKHPLSRFDAQNLAREAQRAHITPLQALQWVLARSSRNFFKAEYADQVNQVDQVDRVNHAAPQAHTRHPSPSAGPNPDAQAQIARQARAQAVQPQACAQAPAIEPNAEPLMVAGARITGPAWATSAVRQFCAGMPVNLFRIQAACSVLGVNRQALRKTN